MVWKREKALLRRSSVSRYPDIEMTDKEFKNKQVISNANPQQKDVFWPTVELVNWYSYDSIPLERPGLSSEEYDTSKSYPLMIYYYELNSDNLHNYRSPRPSASIINPIEYASNEYVSFLFQTLGMRLVIRQNLPTIQL